MTLYPSKPYWRWIALAIVAATSIFFQPANAGDVRLMTIDTLKAQLDDPNLVILDVRTGRDWDSSGYLIKGARRVSPYKADTWGPTLDKTKTIVFYCA